MSQTRHTDPEKTLYLIDVSSFIFRAFFAIRSLKNSKGEPTNAVYGVTTMLAKLVEDAKPHYLAVAYDSKEPSQRKEVYAEYKANRSAPPDDLIPQFARIEELVRHFGFHSYRKSGIEADDLIATLAKKWIKASPDHRVVVVTGDKDLMQLVDDRVRVWDTMNDRFYSEPQVEEKFGVKPTQIRDYLGLVGDSSDNIPGVPGIGPKGAVDLLKQYGDLPAILKAAASGQIPGKKGESIKNHAADAELSARLATLHEDIDIRVDKAELSYEFKISEEFLAFLRAMDFHTLAKKWSGTQPGAVTKAASTVEGAPAPSKSKVSASESPQQQSFETLADATRGASPVIEASSPSSVACAPSMGKGDFRTINTEAGLKEVVAGIKRSGEFGFDVETTSLNPRAAELVGIAICYDPEFSTYIPISHRGTQVTQLPEKMVLDALKPLLEDPRIKKIGQNLKYDWSVMANHGICVDGIGADTMVAAYVLDPEGRHNLDTLASRYLGYSVTNYEEVCGKGKDQIGFDQVDVALATRYSAEDAWVAVKLWEVMRPRLQEERLMEVFARVDLPLVPVLSRMESQGVCIDSDWLRQLSSEFEKDLRRIEERVGAFTSGPINLNSPKQLGHLLFEELKLPVQGKTKTGYSTDAQVLSDLAPLHEVPRLLLEYREISKLKGTYVDTLPSERDPKTGKIHASFHQTVAATGRLSGSDPNLQNIPIRTERGRKIRRAFVPSEGNVLISADYSQIELRLLAHMSADPDLVRSFQNDEDVHRRTASEIFSVPPESVDDRQRGIAKAINFGLMYGKSAFGLSQELKIPRKEAQEVINRYFERYSAVKKFLDRQVLEAKENGWTVTLLGRKRYLPDITSRNHAVRANAERMAMNAPIQGTAADLIKLAMIELDEKLTEGGFGAKMIIQVHDEIVLDCPKKEAEPVCKLVTEVMEGAMKLSVPLRVNAAYGINWQEI